jgi:hypothetical protein
MPPRPVHFISSQNSFLKTKNAIITSYLWKGNEVTFVSINNLDLERLMKNGSSGGDRCHRQVDNGLVIY